MRRPRPSPRPPGAWPGERPVTTRWPRSPRQRRDFTAALGLLDRSLEANALNLRALNLKAAVLRHHGTASARTRTSVPGQVQEILVTAAKSDPLDVRSMAERWLASRSPRGRPRSRRPRCRPIPATALETAAEYLDAGLWEDGLAVLSLLVENAPDKSRISPMVYYDLAFFADQAGTEREGGRVPRAGPQAVARLCLPLPVRGHRGPARCDEGRPGRCPRTLLSGQSALRLAARRGREALGEVGRARSLAGDGPPQPGHRLVASAAGQ